MKNRYINAAFINLIDKLGYIPVKDQNEELIIRENVRILNKFMFDTYIAVEFLDGDLMSAQAIKDRLDFNRNNLTGMQSRSAIHFFEVLVFSSTPDNDKLQAVLEGQYQRYPGRKFLSCLTVDLSGQKVNRHFKFPMTANGLDKLLTSLFSLDISGYETLPDVKELVKKKEKEYSMEYRVKTPVITYSLIAVNVVVWLIINAYGAYRGIDVNSLLHEYGAKDNLLIIYGQYWRFFTPIFLHADIMHLLVNSYSLYVIGADVERMLGRLRFISIYLIAGIAGNIASFMFSPNWGVGASGAIFGLLGALLYFGVENPVLFKRTFGYNVIATIIINIFYGFSNQRIDNFAHMGGLIGGFLVSSIARIKAAPPGRLFKRYITIPVTVLIFIAALLYGFNK